MPWIEFLTWLAQLGLAGIVLALILSMSAAGLYAERLKYLAKAAALVDAIQKESK